MTHAVIVILLPFNNRYGASVSEWYAHPDYAFFETFFSRRLMRCTRRISVPLPLVRRLKLSFF